MGHKSKKNVLVFSYFFKWVELHGDRAGYDDPAIITGLGSINGKTYMFIGHQKGRNTKENISRNFAMPTPHGYVILNLPKKLAFNFIFS